MDLELFTLCKLMFQYLRHISSAVTPNFGYHTNQTQTSTTYSYSILEIYIKML